MIYCISTKLEDGQGGISTALLSLFRTKAFHEAKVTHWCSHDERAKLAAFGRCFWNVVTRVKRDDVVWLHCAQWLSIIRKLLLAITAKLKGARVIVHFHSPDCDSYLKHPLKKRLILGMLALSDNVFVLTPWWRERFAAVFPQYEHKLRVLANAIDGPLLAASDKAHRGVDNPVRLLAMGRLMKEKGFGECLQTLQHLPEEYHLSIAGRGPQEAKLRTLVRQLGLSERVHWLGWLDYDAKLAALKAHDIFLLPSQYDSFGMSFIEAMACGLPVVLLDLPPLREVVPDRQAGIMVQQADPVLLAEAVQRCAAQQRQMGRYGQQHVKANFDHNIIAKQCLDVLAGKHKEGYGD